MQEDPDEAVKIILAGDSTGAKTEKDQKRMMTEIGQAARCRRRQAGRQGLRPNGLRVNVRRIGSRHYQEARGAYTFARLRRDEVIGPKR